MNKIKLLLISAFLCVASFGFAQPKIINVAFFKNNGKYVSNKDSADYFRFISEPDSGSVLFNIDEYYKNGKRKLIGKTSKVEPPVLEGQCARYYKTGKRQSNGTYKNGLEVGDQYQFFPNGKPYLVITFPDNNDRYNTFTNNFLIQANYDSLGTALVQGGTGYYKGYDKDFNYISEEGAVKNGKRDGVWKGNFKSEKVFFTENYNMGELIDGKAVDEEGVVSTYSKTRRVPPQFKGGLDMFSQFLSRHVIYPDVARENDIQGKVIISFVVEKDGKLNDIKVEKSAGQLLDDEAMRVMRNCPRWIPGTEFGRPARVAYDVPVNFSLSNY